MIHYERFYYCELQSDPYENLKVPLNRHKIVPVILTL